MVKAKRAREIARSEHGPMERAARIDSGDLRERLHTGCAVQDGRTTTSHQHCHRCARFLNVANLDIDFTRMLLVAELVEIVQGGQNLGWHCGAGNGEVWYLNDRVNAKYAMTALNDGYLDMPVLFLNARYDYACECTPFAVG